MSENKNSLKNEQFSVDPKLKEQVEKAKTLLSDQTFINDLLKTSTIEDAKTLFKKEGVDVSEEELKVLGSLVNKIYAKNGSLTEEDLASVSAGLNVVGGAIAGAIVGATAGATSGYYAGSELGKFGGRCVAYKMYSKEEVEAAADRCRFVVQFPMYRGDMWDGVKVGYVSGAEKAGSDIGGVFSGVFGAIAGAVIGAKAGIKWAK